MPSYSLRNSNSPSKTPYYPASWNPVLRPCPAKGCPAGRRTPNFVLSGFLLALASCVLHTVFGGSNSGSKSSILGKIQVLFVVQKNLHHFLISSIQLIHTSMAIDSSSDVEEDLLVRSDNTHNSTTNKRPSALLCQAGLFTVQSLHSSQ